MTNYNIYIIYLIQTGSKNGVLHLVRTNHINKRFELRKESFRRVATVRKVEDADPLNNNDGA